MSILRDAVNGRCEQANLLHRGCGGTFPLQEQQSDTAPTVLFNEIQ
jgi:hypothetical protein